MKFLPSQLALLLGENEMRRNLRPLLKYLALLTATICVFSVVFHVIMLYEGQEHSWLTGFYWTLTVMSTLGFGDITFHGDLGRAFSIVVLLSGIVMLMIVLPFTFIRFFYAPWLEAQMRLRAPRSLSGDVSGHVIICGYDGIAIGLIRRLEEHGIPYCTIEADPAKAANLHADGISVVAGAPAASATYEAVRARDAALVFANLGDAANTNVTLSVRESAPDVPIVALADEMSSVDVLELAGASEVVPLKQRLGEHLASRVAVGTPQAHRIGRFEDLVIAEFPIENTSLRGRTVRDTRLRELTGLSIVGVWERGVLMPAHPETVLSDHSVPVIVGTEEQLTELDALFIIYQLHDDPVLVIGGGKVGQAAARALRARDVRATILDKDGQLMDELRECADRVVVGDAAELEVVTGAGIAEAPSVVLTTNDDATNIFLALYCRRLNPEARIVSRINEEWNLEAIHRAGADFALSHSSLAAKSVLSILQGINLVVFGEGADLFVEPVPLDLAGKTLAESGIGATTGLNVIAVHAGGESITNPSASTELASGAELVMLGTVSQHQEFSNHFGSRARAAPSSWRARRFRGPWAAKRTADATGRGKSPHP
ncbi:MAG: NAD-binding protein [Deltaproteobacteria bacterium]|nr:NAD-binding protein [Deltaproteobacteria bacterium]MBW2696043.1 NAD-binding protein [Deltaproteobacteria bacterium]